MTTTFLIISLAVIVIGFIMLFGRRVRANYGSIRPNGKVTESFNSYEVKPGLIYYFSGTEMSPTAIIGVEERWALDSKLWTRIDVSPEQLKVLVQNMKAKVSQRDETLHGFEILDNKGMYMGEWFSILGVHGVVKIGKDDKVTIHPPSIDTYRDEK